MNNIFIAIGQNHVNNFENLIKNKKVAAGNKILVAGSNVVFNTKYWDKTILSKQTFNNNSKFLSDRFFSIFNKISAYKKLIEEIKKLSHSPTTLYVSYIEDVLSNWAFFYFKKNKVIIVEDGTLNYYDHSLQNINKLKFNLKKNIAFLCGIRFKKYDGHSSGAEYPWVVAQYLTFPEQAFVKKNAMQLPIEQEQLKETHNRLYLIGQESHALLIGWEKYEMKLRSFFDSLKQQAFYEGLEKIYYKPHRNGMQIPTGYIEGSFPGKKLEIIHTTLTSEKHFFSEAPSKYLAGFNSSSLLNIYAKLKNEDKQKVEILVYPLNKKSAFLFKQLKFHFLSEIK